ncbi:MAG: hypothetical protein ACM3U2_20540 [Deltaproteobacteria bacterium]
MDDRTYYGCRLRLDGDDKFVIWFQNAHDDFVCAPDGRLVWARSTGEIVTAARDRGITLVSEDAILYDFDRISDWCRCRAAETVDCNVFLNAWNFFDDLAGIHEFPDSNFAMLSRAAANRYDTLFWGCNLPVVTPPGERFEPSWTQEWLDEIATVMEAGIALLRDKLRTT